MLCLLEGFFLVILVLCPNSGAQTTQPPNPCETSTSCLRWPVGCQREDCKVIARFHYKPEVDELLHVDLSTKIEGWVAVGLNENPRMMGGTIGEVCIFDRTGGVPAVILKGFENEETDFHLRDLPKEVKSIVGVRVDGWTVCSYTRPIGKTGFLRDLNKPWFLVSSWGKTKKDKKHPGEHGTGDYFWSKNKVDLKKKNEITATTFGWDLIGVHGSLMVLAWIGFASSGIFYARYTKEVWPSLSCRGNSLWFQLHRAFMIGSTFLVLIAFLVIVAEVKGWNKELGAHPVIGILVIILMCMQAAAGIARPSVVSSWRFIFNLAHKSSGIVILILAIIAIFLGLSAIDVDIVAYIVYLVAMLVIVVGMEARSIYKSRTVTEVQYREEELDGAEMDTEEPNVFSSKEIFIRKSIALFVACVGFGMALVMISLIAHKAYVYHSNARVK